MTWTSVQVKQKRGTRRFYLQRHPLLPTLLLLPLPLVLTCCFPGHPLGCWLRCLSLSGHQIVVSILPLEHVVPCRSCPSTRKATTRPHALSRQAGVRRPRSVDHKSGAHLCCFPLLFSSSLCPCLRQKPTMPDLIQLPAGTPFSVVFAFAIIVWLGSENSRRFFNLVVVVWSSARDQYSRLVERARQRTTSDDLEMAAPVRDQPPPVVELRMDFESHTGTYLHGPKR